MGIGALLREKVAEDAQRKIPRAAPAEPVQLDERDAEKAASAMATRAGKRVGTPSHKALMNKFLNNMKKHKEQEVPDALKKKWKKDDKDKKDDDDEKEPPEDKDDDDKDDDDKDGDDKKDKKDKKVPPFMKKKEKKEAQELIQGVLSGGSAKELVEAHFSKKGG